ncbi:MAG: N-acetylmuramoyl-L-alanine amidase [Clostridia bacterium]|nr:N-acetylmuramoyl-L-alanine amidase [Clostridia bacterium]MDE7328860.1 N-acetylmuramoyl-L-alanine amidase [Clostridia bacterium]
MIISIKKQTLIIFITAIFVVVASCATLLGYKVVGAAAIIPEYTIVIDAGHGGIDGGVVGATGVKESDINLSMSKILKEELESRNFAVVMTRSTADALNNVKRLDMQARKKIIVEANPTLVISLHVNKFSDSSRRGVQVFYDDKGVGKDFATVMQQYLNENINAVYGTRSNYEPISGDLYITKCAPVPSIIIECGFISNPEDEKLLLSKKYCEDLCSRIGEVVSSSLNA